MSKGCSILSLPYAKMKDLTISLIRVLSSWRQTPDYLTACVPSNLSGFSLRSFLEHPFLCSARRDSVLPKISQLAFPNPSRMASGFSSAFIPDIYILLSLIVNNVYKLVLFTFFIKELQACNIPPLLQSIVMNIIQI